MEGYVATAKSSFSLDYSACAFDFGTIQQSIPVLLRQDHYNESFCEVSSRSEKWN